MGPPVTPHNMFIRTDSRLYRSQSSGCHGARRAARIASLYAWDKRATGDPNLRSLHNCRSGGGGRLQRWGEGSTGGERYTILDVKRGGEGGSHFPPSQNFVFFFCFFLTLHVLVHIRLQHQERDHEAESGWEKRKDLSSSDGPLRERQYFAVIRRYSCITHSRSHSCRQ